jgi:hypothetical protein
VSNWKPEIIDGKRFIRCVLEGRYSTAATFYREGTHKALGWTVLFHDSDKHCFAAALPGAQGTDFVEGICCGGPLTIRCGCLVPLDLALAALTYFAQHRDRSPECEWLSEREFYRFD